MQTCTICGCPSNSLNLDLGSFTSNERLFSVEHILDLLIKSRHGTHRFAKKLDPAFGIARDVVPAVRWDLHPNRFSIPNGRKMLSDAVRDLFIATFQICRERIARLVNILNCHPLSKSPANLGRGSPDSEQTMRVKPMQAKNLQSGRPACPRKP